MPDQPSLPFEFIYVCPDCLSKQNEWINITRLTQFGDAMMVDVERMTLISCKECQTKFALGVTLHVTTHLYTFQLAANVSAKERKTNDE